MKIRFNTIATLLVIVALFGLTAFASAATTSGTLVITYFDEAKGLRKVQVAVTTDATGKAKGNDLRLEGRIERISFDPTSTMTDNWDFTLFDEGGQEMTYGAGLNRDTTTSEQIVFNGNSGAYSTSTLTQTVDTDNVIIPWEAVVSGPLSVELLNAGAAKTVTIVFYVRVN